MWREIFANLKESEYWQAKNLIKYLQHLHKNFLIRFQSKQVENIFEKYFLLIVFLIHFKEQFNNFWFLLFFQLSLSWEIDFFFHKLFSQFFSSKFFYLIISDLTSSSLLPAVPQSNFTKYKIFSDFAIQKLWAWCSNIPYTDSWFWFCDFIFHISTAKTSISETWKSANVISMWFWRVTEDQKTIENSQWIFVVFISLCKHLRCFIGF